MSNIILTKEHVTEVQCAGMVFNMSEADDGGLYIESADQFPFNITITDDGESVIKALGQWAIITATPSEE